MGIKQRLDSLERRSATGSDLSSRSRGGLLRLLGKLDALFYPWRVSARDQQHLRSQAEIVRRQIAYRSGLEGLTLKASGASDWRDAQQVRQELVAAGLATAILASGQIAGMFLTPIGESMARRLAGLKTIADCAWVLSRIRRLQTAQRPVHERRLWGEDCTGDPSDWSHYEEGVLPLLSAGIVGSTSSTIGEVFYTATDIDPDPVVVEVDPDPDAFDVYVAAFNRERASLAECENETRDLWIPLPANLGGFTLD